MHQIVEGTCKLPEALVKERGSPWPNDYIKINLEKKITYHIKVDEIACNVQDHNDFQSQKVTVKGKYVSSGQPFKIVGDANKLISCKHI